MYSVEGRGWGAGLAEGKGQRCGRAQDRGTGPKVVMTSASLPAVLSLSPQGVALRNQGA